MSRHLIMAGVLLATLAGCSSISVKYTVLNPPPRPHRAVSPGKIEIFTTAQPSRKYVELGTMTSMHDSITSNDDMFNAMREEAAKRGCDALVVTQRGSQEAVAACVVYND
jgi:hypothetical protein